MRISRIVTLLFAVVFTFFGSNPVVAQTVGEIITNSLGMKFVYCPPGSFEMGSTNGDSDEQPIHTVTSSQGFYLGRTEVTQGEWKAVMGDKSLVTDCDGAFSGEDVADYKPAFCVSWNDAQNFIRKLNPRIRNRESFRDLSYNS